MRTTWSRSTPPARSASLRRPSICREINRKRESERGREGERKRGREREADRALSGLAGKAEQGSRLTRVRWWQALTNQLVEEGTRLEEALAAAQLSLAQVRASERERDRDRNRDRDRVPDRNREGVRDRQTERPVCNPGGAFERVAPLANRQN